MEMAVSAMRGRLGLLLLYCAAIFSMRDLTVWAYKGL